MRAFIEEYMMTHEWPTVDWTRDFCMVIFIYLFVHLSDLIQAGSNVGLSTLTTLDSLAP